jgi:PAS domain S-box-containing protein
MHKTLERQMKKYLGDKMKLPSEVEKLLEAINVTYEGFDNDRELIDRSLEISSRELAEANWILGQYLEIAGVMIVAINREGKITLINKRGCDILGYEKSEAMRKDWFETFLPEEERKTVREVFGKIMDNELEQTEYYENMIITKDGKKKLIAWHNSVLKDKNGNIIGSLSSGDDVTEKRDYEKSLLEKNEDLQKVNSLVIGREMKMVELKKKISELEKKLKAAKGE